MNIHGKRPLDSGINEPHQRQRTEPLSSKSLHDSTAGQPEPRSSEEAYQQLIEEQTQPPSLEPHYQDLTGKLTRLTHHDDPSTWIFLKALASGSRMPSRDEARETFKKLLAAEEFTVLVDAVRLFHDLQKFRAAESGEAPAESMYYVEFPEGWQPRDEQKLVDAFGEIQVDRIVVSRHGLGLPCPRAAAICVAALLHAGARELDFYGSVDEPERIVHAFETSQLRCIRLETRGHEVDAAWVTNYTTLINGLVHCRRLEEVSIQDPRLFAAWESALTYFALVQGPKLTKATVNGWPRDAPERNPWMSANMLLMHALKKHPLSSLTLYNIGATEDEREMAIHIPFRAHGTLVTLKIEHSKRDVPNASEWPAPLSTLAFLNSCPMLTDFSYECGEAEMQDTFASLQELLDSRFDLTDAENARYLQALSLLSSPHFKLRKLHYTGAFLPPYFTRALRDAVPTNQTLADVRLDSRLALDSLFSLPQNLKNHPTLSEFDLATNFRQYYFLAQTPRWIPFGFLAGGDSSSTDDDDDDHVHQHERRGYELDLSLTSARGTEKDAGELTFALMKPFADTLRGQVEQALAENRRQQAASVRQTTDRSSVGLAPSSASNSSNSSANPG